MAKNIRLKAGGNLRINLDKLELIQKQLGFKYLTRVGVLGEKARGRKEAVKTKSGRNKPGPEPSVMSNAEVGLVHEKGSLSRGIPRRSFLMMPLELKFDKYLFSVGQAIMSGLTADNIIVAYRRMGIAAEAVIQQGFATRGFGNWAPNKPSTIARKGSDAPLIDTAQLRKSITSTVVTA